MRLLTVGVGHHEVTNNSCDDIFVEHGITECNVRGSEIRFLDFDRYEPVMRRIMIVRRAKLNVVLSSLEIRWRPAKDTRGRIQRHPCLLPRGDAKGNRV